MKFICAPFTFQLEQVGTNCGLIGQNAVVEIDGAAFWLSPKGFFLYDGTVKTIPCTVEDFVFDDFDTTKGQQVAAGLNNLYTEITWYYPSSSSEYNDKYVIFNMVNLQVFLVVFGIPEQKLEQVGLTQTFIQTLSLQNMTQQQMALFQLLLVKMV